MNKEIVDFLLNNKCSRWEKYDRDRIYIKRELIEKMILNPDFNVPTNIQMELERDNMYYDVIRDRFCNMPFTGEAFREAIEMQKEMEHTKYTEDGIMEEYIDD